MGDIYSMMLNILQIIAVLAAAILLGRWFLSELKKAQALGLPWYKPYLSPPGIIIILIIIFVPILVRYINP